jgi:hypothetical protein
MSRIDVNYLALPYDTDDGDGLKDEIIVAAEERGTEVVYISEDTDITVGNISLRLFAPLEAGDETNGALS